MITWTVVPDNDANLQRRIGDRAIGGQIERDDSLGIGRNSTWIPKGKDFGHRDIAGRTPGLGRTGGQGESEGRQGGGECRQALKLCDTARGGGGGNLFHGHVSECWQMSKSSDYAGFTRKMQGNVLGSIHMSPRTPRRGATSLVETDILQVL